MSEKANGKNGKAKTKVPAEEECWLTVAALWHEVVELCVEAEQLCMDRYLLQRAWQKAKMADASYYKYHASLARAAMLCALRLTENARSMAAKADTVDLADHDFNQEEKPCE